LDGFDIPLGILSEEAARVVVKHLDGFLEAMAATAVFENTLLQGERIAGAGA
jgi:hypothetical protein